MNKTYETECVVKEKKTGKVLERFYPATFWGEGSESVNLRYSKEVVGGWIEKVKEKNGLTSAEVQVIFAPIVILMPLTSPTA